MSWYPLWLELQVSQIPPSVFRLELLGEDASCRPTITDLCHKVELEPQDREEEVTLDDVSAILSTIPGLEVNAEARSCLAFAILGWKSMLYLPAFNVCAPSELAIHQDSSQPDSGLVFDFYRAPLHLANRPLFVLLEAFGNLLPARSSTTLQVAAEASKTAASWKAMYPVEMNAYLLQTLLCVRFRWVDSLALHLDYDKSSHTLSLFAFPSLCASTLQSRKGIIFAFASTEQEAADPRADHADIADLLREVLLSYRLPFGQSSKSRKLFRHVFELALPVGTGLHSPQPDTLLLLLCSEKTVRNEEGYEQDLEWMPRDRPVYFAARDFPVLYERIELISQELKGVKPRSVGGLLRDRRDTLQFWTFWLVSIFGTANTLLSLIQVILQGIQLGQGN